MPLLILLQSQESAVQDSYATSKNNEEICPGLGYNSWHVSGKPDLPEQGARLKITKDIPYSAFPILSFSQHLQLSKKSPLPLQAAQQFYNSFTYPALSLDQEPNQILLNITELSEAGNMEFSPRGMGMEGWSCAVSWLVFHSPCREIRLISQFCLFSPGLGGWSVDTLGK